MANKNVTLTDDSGNVLYPLTSVENVSGLSSQITGLANKDLSNVTYPTYSKDGLSHIGNGDRVIEMKVSSDGLTWYRRWASGWKEVGMVASATSSKAFALPLSFSDTNFVATAGIFAVSYYATVRCEVISASQVNVTAGKSNYETTGTNCSFRLYCCGY